MLVEIECELTIVQTYFNLLVPHGIRGGMRWNWQALLFPCVGYRTTRLHYGFVYSKPDISTTASSSKPKLDQELLGLGAASWPEEKLLVWVLDGRLIMVRVYKSGKTDRFPIFMMVCCIPYQLVTGSLPLLLMRLSMKTPTLGELVILIPSFPTQKSLKLIILILGTSILLIG